MSFKTHKCSKKDLRLSLVEHINFINIIYIVTISYIVIYLLINICYEENKFNNIVK